jgi:predicted SnoaL-like aldol condensation-catalyzing enzyme
MNILKVDLNNLKRPNWSAQELENATLITDFIQHLMNNHDFDYVKKTFNNGSYVQHNRNLEDGIKGVIKSVSDLVKRFPEYTYDVKKIYADGDIIIFHSHVTLKKKDRGNEKKGFVIKDSWKIQNGEIVEHWDAIQPLDRFVRFLILLTGGSIRNTNGLF